jgi:hypothetical protein
MSEAMHCDGDCELRTQFGEKYNQDHVAYVDGGEPAAMASAWSSCVS